MAIPMATPWLHPTTGVYYLRKRVPLDLVAVVGRSLEKKSLGTKDQNEAKRRFAEELGQLEARWRNLRSGLVNLSPREISAIAGEFYRTSIDEGAKWSPFSTVWRGFFANERIEKRWDPEVAESFRAVFGDIIDEWLRNRGLQLDPRCVPNFEIAVARAFRDGEEKRAAMFFDGDYSPDPAASRYLPLAEAFPDGLEAKAEVLALEEQFDAYAADAGLAASTVKRWRGALLTLSAHLGHDDLRRVRVADVEGWVETLRAGARAPVTIRDVHVASLKALMGWLVDKRKLKENPVSEIRIRVPKGRKLRSKALTDAEATTILRATLVDQPPQLGARHALARRWVPWLAAYTGARVNELTQLRREDVFQEGGTPVIRITPEAGSVKTSSARVVPLHEHLVAQGFLDFVRSQRAGPLFYEPGGKSVATPPYKKLGERLASWVRSVGVSDPLVDPNHGWRHKYKTVGRRAGMSPGALDAIQGHATRTEGEGYGEYETVTLAAEVAKIPRYET